MAEAEPLVLLTDEERDQGLMVLARVFVPHAKPERVASRWRRMLLEDPGFLALLGVRVDGEMAGAVCLLRRQVCLGEAQVDVAVVRSLGVLPDLRRQGVATALCDLAAETSRTAGVPLLVVNAPTGFFGGRGFVKVHDPHQVLIEMPAARSLVPRIDRIRPAALADVPLLTELYLRHFAGYLGAPRRDQGEIRRRLLERLPDQAPMLMVDEAGQVRGYFWPGGGGWPPRPAELLALDAEAARDLAQYHAHRSGVWGGVEPMRWVVPADAPTVAAIAAVLPVRAETDAADDTGPMARVTDAQALLAAMEPELAARSGEPRPDFAAASDAVLAQLVFGRRSPAELGLDGAAWAAYFPVRPAWMPELAG
ncbi:MAG: GNAT family N-acetyltransferase [Armatimonadetes bacterium]|nr:GNAT family N-acetyltransferase [Armatimonadota bacterium]